MNKNLFFVVAASASVAFLASCGSGYKKDNSQVIIHELSDPDMLNPIDYSDAGAGYIINNIFQPLVAPSFGDLKPVPVLAESRPTLKKTADGKLLITYRIRPEAKWDNGTQITAKDVEFTLKAIKNPRVSDQPNKSYYEFISDFKFYPEDPLKFTLVCDHVYILAEPSSGDYSILPRYMYDPKGLLDKYTVKQMTSDAASISNDPNIVDFATDFNSEKRMRDPNFISGSGAYKLAQWATGQRVVLERKKNWWGDKLKDLNCYFQAYPSQLTYQTINDMTSAIVALKAGNLDVMYSIKPKDFKDLPQSSKIVDNFNTYTPTMLAYSYIGINVTRPKFADVETRQALAHLCDIPKMIKDVMYGLASPVIGPVHPSDSLDYNHDIQPYDYNIAEAKALLSKAGWKDSDGDGTLDKTINGEKVPLEINFLVNAGNDSRKQVALMFQEEARKVGIKVNVISQDWSVFLDNTKKHNFDMFCGAWIASPVPNDFKQIFSTESTRNGGSNYTNFGNAKSDALIDSIRVELDPVKRAVMYKEFQVILHDQVSYIFLWSPTERMAIQKRFTNANPSVLRPGFWEAGFKLKNVQ
ncbi:MAG: ABC transporter substrate-binding protein [Bacteroidia bacterium]